MTNTRVAYCAKPTNNFVYSHTKRFSLGIKKAPAILTLDGKSAKRVYWTKPYPKTRKNTINLYFSAHSPPYAPHHKSECYLWFHLTSFNVFSILHCQKVWRGLGSECFQHCSFFKRKLWISALTPILLLNMGAIKFWLRSFWILYI